MPTIITGTNGPIFLGYPSPMFGPWNQLLHYNPNRFQFGHNIYYFTPALFGYPPAFPYLGPFVPFRTNFYRNHFNNTN